MFSLQLPVQLDYTAGAMFLRMYSFLVLMYDVLSLIFLLIKAGLEAFYRVFVPPLLKPVAGEIVLVCHYVWTSIRMYSMCKIMCGCTMAVCSDMLFC
jgi:hypothetical protein